MRYLYIVFIENELIICNAWFISVGQNMTYTEIKEVCCAVSVAKWSFSSETKLLLFWCL